MRQLSSRNTPFLNLVLIPVPELQIRFHRKGPSLMSISEDEDGYIDRGGYSGAAGGLPPRPAIAHARQRSAMKKGNSAGAYSHARSATAGSSVRFVSEDSDDDTKSVMEAFQHK